jgi:predicted nuclease of predicted toxin-antitoxin system
VRVLFDQGVPVPLREHLRGHDVRTAFDLGWSQLSNGELLARAEKEFDVLVTTDRNLQHQQNLSGRRLAILVLPTTNWLRLQAMATRIVAELQSLPPGSYRELALQ